MTTWGFKGENRRGLELPGGSTVSPAPSGRARLRYNEATDAVEVSTNGAGYVGITAAGGWEDSNGVVSLVTNTDQVVIGGNTPAGAEKLRVVGDLLVDDQLAVTNSISAGSIISSSVVSAQSLTLSTAASIGGSVSIGGSLDVAGNVGFYGTTPPAQQFVPTLTDNTTGTASATLGAVSGTGDDLTINNNLASLALQVEAVRAALVAYGLSS